MENKEYGFTSTEQEQVVEPVDTIDVQQQESDLNSLQEEIGGELADLQRDIVPPSTQYQQNQEYVGNSERAKQHPQDLDGKFGMNFLDPVAFPPRNIEQGVMS